MRRASLLLVTLLVACGTSSSDDTTDGGGNETADSGSDGTTPITDAGGGSDTSTAPDAADAAPKTGCATVTAKLCEDFDTSTVGQTPTGWTVLKGYAAPDVPTLVASDEFHSPPHALKTSSSVAGASRVQKSLASIGATAGKHWGRIFWKVKSPAPHPMGGGQGPHVPFVALQGNIRKNVGELRVVDTQQAANNKIQLLVNEPDDTCCGGTDFTYTIWDGNWHCSEWYVDTGTQSYRYFLDSTEITSLAFTNSNKTTLPALFGAVGVGAQFFAPLTAPLDTWFDDLAIDDKQIGCN